MAPKALCLALEVLGNQNDIGTFFLFDKCENAYAFDWQEELTFLHWTPLLALSRKYTYEWIQSHLPHHYLSLANPLSIISNVYVDFPSAEIPHGKNNPPMDQAVQHHLLKIWTIIALDDQNALHKSLGHSVSIYIFLPMSNSLYFHHCSLPHQLFSLIFLAGVSIGFQLRKSL